MSVAHRWGRIAKYTSLACLFLAILSTLILNIANSYSSSKIESNAEPVTQANSALVSGPAEISLSISSYPSATGDTNDPNLSLSIPQGGGLVAGRHTVNIETNAVSGFTLGLNAKSSESSLVNTTYSDSVIRITDSAYPNYSELPNNSWGYAITGWTWVEYGQGRPETVLGSDGKEFIFPSNLDGYNPDSPSSTATFTSVPDSSNSSYIIKTLGNYDGDSPERVLRLDVAYGVKVNNPGQLLAGNYQAEVVYTATTNEVLVPTITSIDPSQYELGSETSDQIIITGTNLRSVYEAYLTNTNGDRVGECTNLNVIDNNNISCTIPTTDIAAGEYTIHVVTQGGEASANFECIVSKDATKCTNGDVSSACQVDIDANMIPVRYDGNNSDGSARWLTVSNDEINNSKGLWYNYEEKRWANAVTVKADKLSSYQNKSGVEVNNEDVLGYWVYIPRYAYEVMRRNASDRVVQQQNFDIRFETAKDAKKIPVASCNILNPTAAQMWKNGIPSNKALYDNTNILAKDYRTECHPNNREYPGNDKDLADSKTTWATHPAFTFGDKELNGIWVGKFMMTGSRTTPTVKPNEQPNIGEVIGTFYTMAKNIGQEDANNAGGNDIQGAYPNVHNLSMATSHMFKNSEWGAVTYLSASKYGAGVAGVMMNSSSSNGENVDGDGDKAEDYNNYGGRTGCGPAGVNNLAGDYHDGSVLTQASPSSLTACSQDKSRAYNGDVGVLASTTNNITGVYDMVGGNEEYLAARFSPLDGVTDENDPYFNNPAKSPYVDLYSSAMGFGVKLGWSVVDNDSSVFTEDQGWNMDICTYETCGGQALYEVSRIQSFEPVNNGDGDFNGMWSWQEPPSMWVVVSFVGVDDPWVARTYNSMLVSSIFSVNAASGKDNGLNNSSARSFFYSARPVIINQV